MKFKRSYSNARNLGSAYKFAFGGDINRAFHIYNTQYWIDAIYLNISTSLENLTDVTRLNFFEVARAAFFSKC